MANMFLTNSSRFKPFSFQEMLQPYQMYTEAYNAYSDELANLDIMAGDIASKLTSPRDKELQTTYQKYQEDLTSAMEDFYSKGLTADSRKKLAGLKARYTKELNPINEAYKAYQEDQAYLNKLAVEHPEILIEGAGRGVSDYIGGKRPQITSVNSEDLMNQALAIAKSQAGRTYKESNWTPTAGGRFLERSKETGLNDVDFNNALTIALSGRTDYTPEELGMSKEAFDKLMTNASLINSSMSDIISSPDFQALSATNKQKALNSIIKGVRAGFQYDRKVETESDPMFAYNLKRQEALEKALREKQAKSGLIGSEAFLTPESTLLDYRNKYQNIIGKLNDYYNKFFNENGSLKTAKEIESLDIGWKNEERQEGITIGSYMPRTAMFDLTNSNFSLTSQYNELIQAMIDLGLNPETVKKSDFEEALNKPDVSGRDRARIISDDKGFSTIQTYIENGLLNREDIEEVIGIGEASGDNLNRRYRTRSNISYTDLLDKDGKLNLISINMDYATGQRTFRVKTEKGVREFLMPVGSSFKRGDQEQLETMATEINGLYNGYVFEIDSKGNTIKKPVKKGKTYQFPDGFVGTTTDRIAYLKQEMDIIFGDSVNYWGAQNIGE